MDTRARDGFSLLELLTIVGIIGITGCIAIPIVMHILPNKNLRSITLQIHSALMIARSEACRRNTLVTVVINPEDEPHTYKICVDNGRDPYTNKAVGKASDGKCYDGDDGREEVLQRGPALPNRVVFNPHIGSSGAGTTFPNRSLSFTSRGEPKGNGKGGLGIGSIGLCTTGLDGKPTNTCRRLIVSAAGRVRVSTK